MNLDNILRANERLDTQALPPFPRLAVYDGALWTSDDGVTWTLVEEVTT